TWHRFRGGANADQDHDPSRRIDLAPRRHGLGQRVEPELGVERGNLAHPNPADQSRPDHDQRPDLHVLDLYERWAQIGLADGSQQTRRRSGENGRGPDRPQRAAAEPARHRRRLRRERAEHGGPPPHPADLRRIGPRPAMPVKKSGNEDGFTMIVTVIGMSVLALLVLVAVTAVNGDAQLTTRDFTRKQAYEAAKAGIDEYAFRLHKNTGYWASCTS